MAGETSYTLRILGGVDKALLGSFDQLRQKVSGANQVLGGLGSSLGTQLAGLASGAALIGFTKHAIDAADETAKLSRELGIGVEALSKFQFAADLSGAGEHFRQGMLKFSESVVKAADTGSDAARVFSVLGVKTTDLAGNTRPLDQIFLDTAEAISKYGNGANKAGIAMELFGTRNARFINMIDGGREGIQKLGEELERNGGVISSEQAAKAEEFNDSITRLQYTLRGLAIDVGTRLIPPLVGFMRALTDVGRMGHGAGAVFDVIGVAVKSLAGGLIITLGLLERFGIILGQLPVAAFEAAKGNFSGAKSILKQIDEDTAAQQLRVQTQLAGIYSPQANPEYAPQGKDTRPQAPNIASQSGAMATFLDQEKTWLQTEQEILATKKALNAADFGKTTFERREKELELLKQELVNLEIYIAELQKRRDLESDPKTQQQLDAALRQARNQRSSLNGQAIGLRGQPGANSVRDQLLSATTSLREQFGTVAQNIGEGFKNVIGGAVQSVSDGITGLIMGTKSWAAALAEVGTTILTTVVQSVVQLGVRWVATQILMATVGKALQASMLAATAPIAAAEAAVWAAPASLATIASFGAAAVAAPGLIASANAAVLGASLAQFAEGGYTGNGPVNQAAGIVHGREYVVPARQTSRYFGILEDIRRGTFEGGAARTGRAGDARADRRSGAVNVGFLNTRQDEREFARREGAKIALDQMRKRGAKLPV